MSFRVKPSYPSLDRSHSLVAGLQLAMPFFEGAGRPQDISDNRRNAALVGGPGWVAGKGGWAISFNGANYIDVDYVPAVTASGNYSLTAWISTTQTGVDRYFFSLGNTADTTPLVGLINQDGKFRALVRNNAFVSYQIIGTRVVNDGNWHMVGFVRNGGTISTFIDGELEANASIVGGAITLNTTSIGALRRSSVGLHYTGLVDDPRIYDRGLSIVEMQQIYHDPWAIYRPRQRSYFYAATAEPPPTTFKPYWRQSPQLSTAGVIG
jgi:hypothetical protein